MDESSGRGHSPALLEAQRQLTSLRARHLAIGRLSEKAAGDPLPKQHSLPQQNEPALTLPEHLGWGSAPLTTALSISRANSGIVRSSATPLDVYLAEPSLTARECPQVCSELPPLDRAVKVYPDIALAMLRMEQVAAGRIGW